MALNSNQVSNARRIYQSGIHAGLAPNRALELVAASYAESGLSNTVRNRSSGATGLFQLLSSGYVNKANRLGGVTNPQANIDAILPDYVSYWRSHPNAAPGEAASAVERSGMGASFYAGPLRIVGSIGGLAHGATMPGGGAPLDTTLTLHPATFPTSPDMIGNPTYAQAQADFAHQLISSLQQTQQMHDGNIPGLLSKLQSYQSTLADLNRQNGVQSSAVGTSSSAAPDRSLTSLPGASTSRPGKLDTRLVAVAHRYGLQITSGYRSEAQNKAVGGVPDSYHLRGEAIDVAPTEKAKQFYRYALAHPQLFTELFYDPAGLFIKNGRVYKGAIGGHSDHVHIVLANSGGPG